MKTVTKIIMRPVRDLIAAEYNPRKISDEQFRELCDSIKRGDFVEPVIVNMHPERLNILVSGHQRVRAAHALGIEEVPTVEVEYDLEREREMNIRMNKNTGEFDLGILSAEFDSVDLESWGFDLEKFEEDLKLEIGVDETPEVEDDEVPEVPEDPTTKPGDVWKLGRHRLICGDSTDADVVGKVLNDQSPFMMVTDPPYGVEYDADWRNQAMRADGSPSDGRAVGKVENDDRADWSEAWALCQADVCYVWHASVFTKTVAESLESSDFVLRYLLIWAKNQLAIGRGHYHHKHEPCWYGVRKGATAKWQGDRKQTTVWDIDKPSKSETGHSTQKPIECMARPIRHHGDKDDLVYDPFLGSGTTLIAAEQLGRTCYGCELSPAYCDVIVQRWENLTGEKAELE